MTLLRDHRDRLIAMYTKTLDEVILAQEDRPDSSAESFELMLNVNLMEDGRKFRIASTPKVDFTIEVCPHG